MKIEKLNDNQIRCTLTHADLQARHLKLSELAYGTEKARSLFRDMMQQASFDFGFEADNIPLMIEAIPASQDSIVLIITKVEDPDELDTRFSKFTPFANADVNNSDIASKLEGAEEFMDLINRVKEAVASSKEIVEHHVQESNSTLSIYSFESLDQIIQAARLLASSYQGANTLYYDADSEIYLLAITRSDESKQEFNKVSNMLTEFGTIEKSSSVTLALLEEHCEIVISADALQKLSTL